MTDDEFKKAIIEEIHKPLLSQDTRKILVEFKEGDGKQARAYEILMGILLEMREAGVEEEVDDALTDTMDSVVGDIAPAYRIWPDRLDI